jgi:hypothetical protein
MPKNDSEPRGCWNCARCFSHDGSAPFALISEFRFGRMTISELKEHYGICGANHMVVKLGCTGMMTPCALIDYERRA